MNVSNIETYWSGENFVIVYNNCSPEQASKVLNAVSSVCDQGLEIQPIDYSEEHDEMLDAETPQDVFVLREGRYKGMTPKEALLSEKDPAVGFANLTFLRDKYRSFDENAAGSIDAAMKDYFKSTFGHCGDPYEYVTSYSMDDCDKFLKYHILIMSDEDMEKVLKTEQKSSMLDFLDKASLEQKRSLIAAIIEKYA